jgi:hypothetical protein
MIPTKRESLIKTRQYRGLKIGIPADRIAGAYTRLQRKT